MFCRLPLCLSARAWRRDNSVLSRFNLWPTNVPVDCPDVTFDGTKLVVPSSGAELVCAMDLSILSDLTDRSSPDSDGHNASAENSSVNNGHQASVENEQAPIVQPAPITIASDLI